MQISSKIIARSILSQLLLSCVFALSSCDKIPAQHELGIDPADSLSSGYFICNEGNFQWGNASLSFYNTQSHKLYDDVFKSINKRGIGDVLQSVSLFNNIAFLIVNNSGKIEMIDPKTFVSIGTVNGFKSPRFLLGINTNKAYVSDLYDNRVSVIDISQRKITNTIPCKGWTEEMVLFGNKVFISNKTSGYLFVANTQTDQLIDSLYIGYGSQCLQLDAQNFLWVLTTGNTSSIPPQLHKIDPSNLSISSSYNFALNAAPIKLMMNPAKSKLFWINTQAYSMSTHATSLPANPFVSLSNKNIYALGYNKNEDEILIADAKDYVQRSEILRYDTTGKYLGSFLAGINSSYLLSK